MSNYLHYASWSISLLLQITVVAIMLRRGAHREFRAFFCYQLFHVLRALVLFGVLKSRLAHLYSVYFWTYWPADVISTGIVLVVIYGVFRKVFRDYEALRRFASLAFGAGVVVMLAVAIGVTALAPGNEAHPLVSAILLFERSLMVLEVGLVFLLAVFARFAAIPWRGELSFGIVMGFGVNAAISLTALTLRAELGVAANQIYNFLTVSGYVVAVFVWFLYILAPVRKAEYSNDSQSQLNVREWNEALTELLSR